MSLTVETARDILLDAFDDISVHMDETTLGASDERTGMKGINRIMATLESSGLDLGFTRVTNISDTITVPDGAMDALISLLGFRLWPKYRTLAPTPAIITNARRGLAQMYKLGTTMTTSDYPSTLPRGSGNTGQKNTYDTFYAGSSSDTAIPASSVWHQNLADIWDETADSQWEEV